MPTIVLTPLVLPSPQVKLTVNIFYSALERSDILEKQGIKMGVREIRKRGGRGIRGVVRQAESMHADHILPYFAGQPQLILSMSTST